MSFINLAWPFSKRESKMATGSSKPTSPNTKLDLAQLHDVLFPTRIQYKSFGLQIGVGFDEIACIEKMNRDPGDCLLAILDARLRMSEPLTWNDIDAALRKGCVGLGNTANDIRKRYPHLFTPTASEHGHEKQEKKVDEKDAHHHHHEHTVKSEDILEEEQKGSDYQARMNKERERISEYSEGMKVGQDAKGKSTDSSRETYHKTRSKPPRKEAEGRDGKREVVSEKKAKKATAPPLERDLPSSEKAQTDSGDGESDESSEDENELEQQSSDEEEETENDSTAEEKEEKRSEKSRKAKKRLLIRQLK